MSTNNITIVMKQQIVTALKQIWSKMDTKSSPDAVAQEMFAILFPEDSAVPKKDDDSDKESTSSKRSEAAKARWANKSEEEKEAAKAKLAAGRAAAKAKKAQAQDVPKKEETPPAPQAPAPKAEPAAEAPAKTSRSDAAKARWAAMSEEEKQAAKDKLAAGRAAKKAAKETGAHV